MDALEERFVLVEEELVRPTRPYSREGCFWPYSIEERIPALDEPEVGRLALWVRLIPECGG